MYCTKYHKECTYHKCRKNRKYASAGLPCAYGRDEYMEHFPDDLREIDGEKIRRNYFNLPSYYVLGIIATFLISTVKFSMRNSNFDVEVFFFDLVSPFVVVYFLMVIMSFLNSKFFGRIVCVLADDGIYTNQAFISYDDIDDVEYIAVLPKKYGVAYNYATINSRQKFYFLPHAPRIILNRIKKRNSLIKTKLVLRDLYLSLIVAVIMIVALIFIK